MYRDLRIKDSVRILFEARKKLNSIKKYVDEINRKESLYIKNFMFSNLRDKVFEITLDEGEDYYQSPQKVRVQQVARSKIVWKLEKLKEKLTKEQISLIVDKEYTIVDMKGLSEYLKSCGVNAKEFRKYINVSEQLSESKLEIAYETGEIKKKQLEGCYEVENVGEPFIKITELKS